MTRMGNIKYFSYVLQRTSSSVNIQNTDRHLNRSLWNCVRDPRLGQRRALFEMGYIVYSIDIVLYFRVKVLELCKTHFTSDLTGMKVYGNFKTTKELPETAWMFSSYLVTSITLSALQREIIFITTSHFPWENWNIYLSPYFHILPLYDTFQFHILRLFISQLLLKFSKIYGMNSL